MTSSSYFFLLAFIFTKINDEKEEKSNSLSSFKGFYLRFEEKICKFINTVDSR